MNKLTLGKSGPAKTGLAGPAPTPMQYISMRALETTRVVPNRESLS